MINSILQILQYNTCKSRETAMNLLFRNAIQESWKKYKDQTIFQFLKYFFDQIYKTDENMQVYFYVNQFILICS